MSVMELKITIGPIEERDDALLGSVVLHDGAYTNLEVALDYLIANATQELTLHAVKFEPTAEAIAGAELYQLQPSAIRDFPLVRWDRSARASIRRALGGYPINPGDEQSDSGADYVVGGETFQVKGYKYADLGDLVEDSEPRRRRELAEAAVARLRPDLDPSEGKGAQRSWNSLVRYAEIFDEHEGLLARGVRDPISTLAKRHEVEKPTVRSWLHRAKEAGIPQVMRELGSVVSTMEPPAGVPEKSVTHQAYQLGRKLQEARLAAGMTVRQVSVRSNIETGVIEAMERGDFAACGEGYNRNNVRLHLRVFASAVNVKPATFIDFYEKNALPVFTKPMVRDAETIRRTALARSHREATNAAAAQRAVENAKRDGA